MNSNVFAFLLLTLAGAALSQGVSLHDDIARQWHSSDFDRDALRQRYVALCTESEIEFEDGMQSTLCELAAQELINSTLQSGLTLEQFQLLNTCSGDEDEEEDCYPDPVSFLEHSLQDALSVSLCQVENARLKSSSYMFHNIDQRVFRELILVYDCKEQGFSDSFYSDIGFSTRPAQIDALETPKIVQWLEANIYEDNESLFLENIQLLDKSLAKKHGDSLLRVAVVSDNNNYLNALIAAGVDVTAIDHYFDQPLFSALEAGSDYAAAVLLNSGVRANAVKDYSGSALLVAVENSSTQTIELLLAKGARTDGQSDDVEYGFQSPLLRAAELGRSDVVSALLKSGAAAQLRSPVESGLGWLEAAAFGGNDEIFTAFVDEGLMLPEEHYVLIDAALKGGNAAILRTVFRLGAELPKQNSQKLLEAIARYARGDIGAGDRRRTARMKQTTPNQRVEQLDVLLANGLQLHSDDYPVHEYIDMLISPFQDPAEASNPLAANSYTERQNLALKSIRVALEQGMDIDAPYSRSKTLLLDASRAGNLAVVELLVELGADIGIETDKGKKAKDYVASQLALLIDRSPQKDDKIADYTRVYKLLGGKLDELPPAPKRENSLFNLLLKLAL